LKFQYLTFDCYGTLIDWRKGIEAHLGKLLRKNGVVPKKKMFPIYVKLEAEEESDSKPYREVLKNTAMRIASHFGMSVPEEQAVQRYDRDAERARKKRIQARHLIEC